MAQKISTLPAASLPLSGAETTYVIQNGVSKKTPASSLSGNAGLTVGSTNISGAANGYVLYNNNGKLGAEASGGSGTVTSVSQTVPSILTISGSPVTTSGTLAIGLATETANSVLAGPTSGAAATPAFRALVGGDLPNPSATTIGGVESYAAVSNQFLTSISTSGAPTSAQPSFTNLSGQATNAQLATQTANTLLGALTATTPSGLAVPSCSAAGDALLWTSGTGFSCATGYLSSGVTTFSAGSTGFTPNSATSGAVTLAGTLAAGNGGTGLSTASSTGVPQISAGTWSVSTTLPSGLTAPSLTVTTGFTATGLVTNGDLANSTISGVSLGSNLNTLTFGTHLSSGASSYNGSAVATLTSDATNANTASTIVARDGSGNFTAGTITASLTGGASLDLPLAGGTVTGALTFSGLGTGTQVSCLGLTSGNAVVPATGACGSGSGGVTIGNAVSGGTNSTSLYVNSSGNLANAAALPFGFSSAQVSLTASGTTFTPVLANSNNIALTLVASTDTIANPTISSSQVGQWFTLVIAQPASGGPYTVGTWGSGYTWAAGSAPTLATAASATTVVNCLALATTPTMLCYGPVSAAFTASTVQSPTAPNSTSSYLMQGFAGTVTPTRTGNVELELCGTIISAGTTTATIGILFQLSYGTGTAPTVNTTLAGTQVGPVYQHWNGSTLGAATDGFTPGCWAADVVLTVGTTYWLDVAAKSVGTASDMGFSNTQIKAHEYAP